MQYLTLRALVLFGCVAATLSLATPARAQERLDKNAQFCEDFDQDVIIAGKLDLASKYLTSDFKEHNVRLTANGLTDFVAKMTAMRAAQAARASGAGRQGGGRQGGAPQAARTIISHDDVVIFMRPLPDRDDPNNAGQKIPGGTHFDVYKLVGGKISEHWD